MFCLVNCHIIINNQQNKQNNNRKRRKRNTKDSSTSGRRNQTYRINHKPLRIELQEQNASDTNNGPYNMCRNLRNERIEKSKGHIIYHHRQRHSNNRADNYTYLFADKNQQNSCNYQHQKDEVNHICNRLRVFECKKPRILHRIN